jgi:hypothetical protein
MCHEGSRQVLSVGSSWARNAVVRSAQLGATHAGPPEQAPSEEFVPEPVDCRCVSHAYDFSALTRPSLAGNNQPVAANMSSNIVLGSGTIAKVSAPPPAIEP